MKQGLLIISHGSRDLSWVTLVDEAIAQVQWPEGLPVASSFLECVPERDIQAGIDELEAQGVEQIAVIPLFISSGSTHVDEIAWALGVTAEPLAETDLERFRVQADVVYGRPLDAHAAMLAMVEDRVAELAVGADARVLLIAHGSPHEPFQTRWRDSLSRIAERLVAQGTCAAAGYALLCCDDVPARVQALACEDGSGTTVAVVPLFLSRGYFTTKVIPERLAALSGDQTLQVIYKGNTLLPHRLLPRWLEQECNILLSNLHV